MKQREIFIEAMQKEEGEERRAFLDAACGDDVELRTGVEELLTEHRKDDSFFLDAPPPRLDVTADMPAMTERPGAEIGPYKLLQQIGEGGMGAVYMAEQKQPVKRRVALKIIKPGMDTRQIIARFEAERQALAMMDHPNIAKVLDVGQTDSGRPYFVMELVNGIPVTQFCDEQHLTARERLDLFIPICQAVQHAHQKGIVHRDIKPSNLLVALYDGRPVPKVIDFGVAKATVGRLTEKTMFTGLGQIVGTIEYMSPEQAQRNQLDIDTRSDVYSLGVVLYELLCGDTPFDRQRLRSATIDELLRIIREEEPPKPSTRLSGSETLPAVAAKRKIEPVKLSALIRGELDWIVLKALEKDRARRYETANGLAADIQCYLNDEPVQACPPTALYRFTKFARRNKAGLATALVVSLALLLTTVGVAVSVGWAVRNRAAVEEQAARERAAWKHANLGTKLRNSGDLDGAIREFEMAIELNPDLTDAYYNLGRALEAKGDLVGAIRKYEKSIAAEPNHVEYHRSLGNVLLDNEDLEGAMRQFYAAIAIDPNDVKAYFNLARSHKRKGDLDEAVRNYTKAIEIDPQHASSHLNLGMILKEKGDLKGAIREFRNALAIDQRIYLAQRHLGDILRETGDNAAAIDAYRTAIALRNDGGGPHLNLALALQAMGDHKGAAREREKAAEFAAETALDYSNRGIALRQTNDFEGSVIAIRKAIEIDPENAYFVNNLGDTFLRKGDLGRAVATYKHAIEVDPNYYRPHHNLGKALRRQGDVEGAIQEFRSAAELNPKYVWAHVELGNALIQTGRHAQAIPHITKAISLGKDGHERWVELAVCHRALGNDEAYDAACRLIVEKFPEPDGRSIADWGYLGKALYRAGQVEQARRALKSCIELRGDDGPSGKGGPRWWYYTMSLYTVGETDLANTYFKQLNKIMKEEPLPSDHQYARLHAEAAELLSIENAATTKESVD